jgi:hypothetical protein
LLDGSTVVLARLNSTRVVARALELLRQRRLKADLGNNFAFVRNMRPFPVDLNGVIPLIVATALPMLPLVLTVYPFDELVLKIAGFLF